MPRPCPISGLSPRVRGNRPKWPINAIRGGSIPACAGEPVASGNLRGSHGVYPRVCGGTMKMLPVLASASGLSPRVRGNPRDGLFLQGAQGSIPACAGEPGRLRLASGGPRVYPRVCGGTWIGPNLAAQGRGLSPRVRGNRRNRKADCAGLGSIPACAGEPQRCRSCCTSTRVYPRVCGGTLPENLSSHPVAGLSPRVRGNPWSLTP